MKQQTDGLIRELTEGLQEIAVTAENKLQLAQRSLLLCDEILKRLKEYMRTYIFKDATEEILFFKEIKPSFQRELYYFEELYFIESHKPVGTEESIRRYLEYKLNRINDYFEQNRIFYNYYLSGAENNDLNYFVRSPLMPVSHLPVYAHDLDAKFSTPYSCKLAKFQAFEQARHYLNRALSGPVVASGSEDLGQDPPVWNGNKNGIVEVAAALYYSGVVNYGKGGFNKFVQQFAGFFNTPVGNVPRIMYGFSLRKKDEAPFLNFITGGFVRMIRERNS
ncbi:RteC domain-containing protein [Mucilaginibacter sp. UC70_90]